MNNNIGTKSTAPQTMQDFLFEFKKLQDLRIKIEHGIQFMEKSPELIKNCGLGKIERKKHAALMLKQKNTHKSIVYDIGLYRSSSNKIRAQSARWINVLENELKFLTPAPAYNMSKIFTHQNLVPR